MSEATSVQTAVLEQNGGTSNGNGNSARYGKKDTGHARNAANFGMLISALSTYGSIYNPSSADITLNDLKIVQASLTGSMNSVKKNLNEYRECVNKRQAGFKNMGKLTTKIKKAARACKCDKMDIDEISSIKKKIDGVPAKKETDSEGHRSISQRSYDLRLDNFNFLVDKLGKTAGYNPNETHLTMETLISYAESLGSATVNIQDAINILNKARTDRDHLLYDEPDGVVPMAQRIKQYIGSIYDSSTSEYKRVSKIKFTNLKKAKANT